MVWIAAGALGALGAVGRFVVDGAVARRLAGELPWGTLTVNVVGSLALGVLVGAGVAGDQLFLAGGALIGSFTTFSTWMLETHRLAQDGEDRLALANLALGVALGLAGVAAGWWIGGRL